MSSDKNSTSLGKMSRMLLGLSMSFWTIVVIFDWIWLVGYCCYIGLFLFFPVHYILAENYPIVTRIIILIEQVILN